MKVAKSIANSETTLGNHPGRVRGIHSFGLRRRIHCGFVGRDPVIPGAAAHGMQRGCRPDPCAGQGIIGLGAWLILHIDPIPNRTIIDGSLFMGSTTGTHPKAAGHSWRGTNGVPDGVCDHNQTSSEPAIVLAQPMHNLLVAHQTTGHGSGR